MSITVGGHRLAAVARRSEHRAACECCGIVGRRELWRVKVRAVADGRQTTVVLCERCVCSEDSAWRLRWAPVPYER